MMTEQLDYFWKGTVVRLRATQKSDWEDWRREQQDSDAVRLMEWGIELPKSEASERAMSDEYDDFRSNYRRMFAIETHDNVLVGLINLSGMDQKNGTFGISFCINKQFRKNGYGLDAARIALRYAFHELRLQKCNSGCVSINEASRALHRKLGFREEGLRRRSIYMNGQYYDDLLLGLLREEFDEAEERRFANDQKK